MYQFLDHHDVMLTSHIIPRTPRQAREGQRFQLIMDDRDRQTLQKYRDRLQKDLEPARVASQLFAKGIFSEGDEDEVASKATNFEKNKTLLDKLPRKGPQVFGMFCDVLKELSPHLEQSLRPNQVQEDDEDGRYTKGRPLEDVEPAEERHSITHAGNAGDRADGNSLGSKTSEPSGSCAPPSSEVGNRYKMDKDPQGIAVIINNKFFLPESGMEDSPRKGTDVDRDALKKLFEKLHFHVEVHDDVTCSDIRKILKELAGMDHSQYNAVIVAILTHGEENIIFGTDGELKIAELTSWFTGKNLAGKPKLFFFQACQGDQFMHGSDVLDGPVTQSKGVSVPAEADFMCAYSTVPGYYAWRNKTKGSWFIESVVNVFKEHADQMDLLHMMTRVNASVATYKSDTGHRQSDQKMQIPSIVSRLRKDLYFFPEKIFEKN